jgi:hypothetical protein
MKKLFLVLLATAATAFAQEQADPTASPSPTPTRLQRGVWQADLPGGKYIVRLSAITSVSIHEYIVDNAARVAEVNIGTAGSELVRFYVIEPNVPKAPGGIGQSVIDKAQEKANELLDRTKMDATWSKVMKSYPTTTHAHTIEYRLPTRESLDKLFESIQDSWLNQRAAVFKP